MIPAHRSLSQALFSHLIILVYPCVGPAFVCVFADGDPLWPKLTDSSTQLLSQIRAGPKIRWGMRDKDLTTIRGAGHKRVNALYREALLLNLAFLSYPDAQFMREADSASASMVRK